MFKDLSYFYFFNFLQMKKLYFLFFFTIGLLAKAQIVNIPDANFKARLVGANGGLYASTQAPVYNTINENWEISTFDIIDTNGDGEIQVSEAQAIKYLSVTSSPGNNNITDLTGIESFTNLIYLSSTYNEINSINLTQNIELKFLKLYGCGLYNNLNLSQNTNLITLECSSSGLTNLNLTNNVNLEYLDCDSNFLTNLDLSQNLNLKYLECNNNQLSNLIVAGLTNLKRLIVFNNNLTSLNLSNLTSLEDIMCSSNQLIALNLFDLVSLKNIQCGGNFLTNIDFSQNINLNIISCDNNQINNLNLNGLINLYDLKCNNNLLTSLDVSELTNLDVLWCDENQLTYLNLKNGNDSWENLFFLNNPNLNFICADEEVVDYIQWLFSVEEIQNCHVNSYCTFKPGGKFYEISGATKLDSNNNGCDVSDINYSNLIFSITDGTNTGSLIANQTGNYYIPVSAGNHTITPILETPSYFNVSPTSFSIDFPTQISPFTQDFCVTANGFKHDVEVVLIPTVPARPGFDATYKLVYRNKGNQIENGSISLTFDDTRLDYVTANPIYNYVAVNNFTWNYSNLQPFESREITLVLNVNSPMEAPAVNNGDQIDFLAQITPFTNDEVQYDNISTLKQIVLGSFDPNDKTCIEGTTITPSEVGNYVHYIIRFENTGTFPAENIVVKDMIDLAKFDIATLVPLKSSHDFFTRINGNKVEFIFENINLDFNDATNDGYVVFKIKTLPTLVLGDTFTNNANIYFDYNFPITTNTYTTTVAALSTQDFDFGTYFTLYPNPAKDVLNMQAKQDVTINSIEIYNQLGQIVMATTNAINSVDVSNLASGTYFVKVNTEKGSANAKFVKE